MGWRSIAVLTCFTLYLQSASMAATGEAAEENDTEEQGSEVVWQPLEELQQAAGTEDPIAITKLADYFFWGPGEDPQKAVSLYERAAKMGSSHAQFSVGFALYAGFGVKWDPKKAAVWFRKAAEQGHPIAQSELALLYSGGLGVKRSHKEAFRWARQSAEQGWPVGQLRLGRSLWQGRGVAENKRDACMWFIISDVPEENKKKDLDSCLSKFGAEELDRIRSDANAWLDAHPKAREHEYESWISPNWLD